MEDQRERGRKKWNKGKQGEESEEDTGRKEQEMSTFSM